METFLKIFCFVSILFAVVQCRRKCVTVTSATTRNPNCSLPCPTPLSKFCEAFRDENCDCLEQCCDLPECEGSGIDWANCNSCSDCPCLPKPNCTAPCETGSSFCYGYRDEHCECQTICCAPPLCEGSGVNWDECTSCGHCPCLPVITTLATTSTTDEYCRNFCDDNDPTTMDTQNEDCTCNFDPCVTCEPGYEVSLSDCRSCSDCPCKQITTSMATSEPPP